MTLKPAPHTLGPWRVYQEKPHYYSVGTDYTHDRSHECNIVREVRCEANARLMAAAPELLDSLESLLAYLREFWPLEPLFSTFDDRQATEIADAEAIIRKAKSE